MRHRRGRHRSGPLVAAVVGLLVAGLAACGGDDGEGLADGGPELTGAAARGQELAEDKGCTACHSPTGGDRTGPTWKGLWGSEVDLADGEAATVDGDYLRRSITDPDAEVVDGYTAIMPDVPLDDAEIDDLVAYIEALG